MKTLICNMIIFFFLVNNIFSSDIGIGGLNYLQNFEEVIRDARFDSESDRIFIIKRINHSILKRLEQVFVYEKETQIEKVFFDPAEFFSDMEGDDSISIDSLFVLEDFIIIIVTERSFEGVNKPAKTIIKRYKVDKNGLLLEEKILDHFERRLYDRQSTSNRNIITDAMVDRFTRLNLNNDSLSVIKFSERIVSDFQNTPVMIGGRYDDEVVLIFCPARRMSNESKIMKLCFYSSEIETFKESIFLPSTFVESLEGNNISDSILSPLSDKIILNHFAYGIWLYDLKERAFYPLILLEEYPIENEIYVKDWSWDGERVLVQIGKTVYEIWLEDFLEQNVF